MGKRRPKSKPTDGDDEKHIEHEWHREHPLRLRYHAREYNCVGCVERGYGFRYRCEFCEFDLHEACAHGPPTSAHPCHPRHSLYLFPRPPASNEGRNCDVCDQEIKGALYSCAPCDFDVHLSCMKLPPSVFHGTHPEHRLQLYLALPDGDSLPAPPPSATCFICARPFKAGVANYSCAVPQCRFFLHVTCAKLPVDPFAQFRVACHEVFDDDVAVPGTPSVSSVCSLDLAAEEGNATPPPTGATSVFSSTRESDVGEMASPSQHYAVEVASPSQDAGGTTPRREIGQGKKPLFRTLAFNDRIRCVR